MRRYDPPSAIALRHSLSVSQDAPLGRWRRDAVCSVRAMRSARRSVHGMARQAHPPQTRARYPGRAEKRCFRTDGYVRIDAAGICEKPWGQLPSLPRRSDIGGNDMAAHQVEFRFMTGVARRVLANCRLRGGWDASGKPSDDW